MFHTGGNRAVSQVIGFVLVFSIVSGVVISTLLLTSSMIENKKVTAAEIEARSIANIVANAIMEASQLKEWYPKANYSRYISIPTDLAGYNYYIDVTDEFVYVNTTNGISVSSPLYNVGKNIGVSGKVYGSSGTIDVYCNETDYVYRLDFGSDLSLGEPGYTRVSDTCNNSNWWDNNYNYRVPIFFYNPNDEDLTNFQVEITFSPSLIDYSHFNPDGSDIRFVDQSGNICPYWIERWDTTGISVVWVKVPLLPSNTTTIVFMYYGNKNAQSMSNGDSTFYFFDDFSGRHLDTDRWIAKNSVSVDGGYLVLGNNSAVVTKSATLPVNCTVDVKCSAVVDENDPDQTREGSMFVRCQNKNLFYKSGYTFLSGLFNESHLNLAILKDDSKVLINTTNDYILINGGWYILRYILEGNLSIAVRYIYDDQSFQDGVWSVNESYPNDGYFGLCTTHDGNYTAYYDWIFVHKFSKKSIKVVVGGENSLHYYWQDINSIDSDYFRSGGYLYGDFVFSNTSSNTFVVDLPNGIYSVSVVVGIQVGSISGENITVDPKPIMRGKNLNYIFTGSGVYFEDWFVVNVTTGKLRISFDDNNGEYKWVINSMVIERGVKGVKIR